MSREICRHISTTPRLRSSPAVSNQRRTSCLCLNCSIIDWCSEALHLLLFRGVSFSRSGRFKPSQSQCCAIKAQPRPQALMSGTVESRIIMNPVSSKPKDPSRNLSKITDGVEASSQFKGSVLIHTIHGLGSKLLLEGRALDVGDQSICYEAAGRMPGLK